MQLLLLVAPTLVLGQWRAPAEPSGPCEKDTFKNSLNSCSSFSVCPHGTWVNTHCPAYFMWDYIDKKCVYSPDGMGVPCIQA